MPTAEKETALTPKVYASRYPSLKLIHTPIDDITVDNKGHTKRVPGITLEFFEGRYQTGERTERPGQAGYLSHEDEIEFLEQHVNKGNLFYEVSTDAIAPPSGDTITRILAYTASQDVKRIETVLTEERAGWQRDDVLRACETALEAIRVAQDEKKD